jgi:precorrin-8X/cobalt-precorrin-8 methylmutase
MALSGVNLARLGSLESRPLCLIDDPRVVEAAKAQGLTRAMAAVDLACASEIGPAGAVWVFGNAPTALLRLIELLEGGRDLPRPRLVIGLPVGFVNAAESKRALAESGLPHLITNRGRKGGSNVAAAAVNALAALARSAQP